MTLFDRHWVPWLLSSSCVCGLVSTVHERRQFSDFSSLLDLPSCFLAGFEDAPPPPLVGRCGAFDLSRCCLGYAPFRLFCVAQGKTLQTISFLGWLKNEKSVYGPFLVVVPLSTMAAWQREFARWLPDVNVVTYVGDASSREHIRKYEFAPSPRSRKSSGVEVRFHVLLSTPELVMMDQAHLGQLRYAVIAVDEAHRLKNEESSLHRILAEFRSANRLLITGTPLQNSIRELWALLHFLTPDEFANAAEFEEQFSFSALREPETVAALHMALRPYVLRRQKGDVEKSLPRKTYAVLRVGMASTQQEYYRWILTRNFSKLNAAAKSGGRSLGGATSLLNIVMELKKCCNHPYLFDGVEDNNASDPMTSLIRASGKMILLDKLLLRLRDAGHRVLIFSQMVRMLDILQDYCRMRGFACQRLDGSMPNDLRQRAVDHYNAPNSNDFAFLLSTRAGGLGINLATADTVIIFDSDWNPQNDLQAESRAHRIGQTRDVKVFRLLSRDTVEEDILERAKRKRVLEHLVIHGVERGEGEASAAVPKPAAFRKEELSAILRFGAEQLFKSGAVDGVPAADVPDGAAAAPPPTVAGGAAAGAEKPLEMDDIDEVLQRAPAEEDATEGGGGTMGDSLLNAFKWADFATNEEPDEEAIAAEAKSKKAKDKARVAAEAAASKLTALERTQKAALQDVEQREAADRDLLHKEGDGEFWGRVIPRDVQEDMVASQLYLAPRSRKRVKHYAKDHGSDEEGSYSDEEVAGDGGTGDGKRRGGGGASGGKAATGRGRGKGRKPGPKGAVTGGSGAKPPRGKGGKRAGAARVPGDVSDQGDEELTQERRLVPGLTAKEVRALVKALRKFGIAERAESVVTETGLVDRVSVEDARKLLESVLSRAHKAVDEHAQHLEGGETDEAGMANGGSPSIKSKARVAVAGVKRVASASPSIVVGGEFMNAAEMVVRQGELAALATAVGGYPSDMQFRLRAAAKPPTYGVKWTTVNDAMLLVGIHRYGFGNWKSIAADEELGLSSKLSTPGAPVVGAPDAPKVVRRAITLLRSVSASVAASNRAAARVAAGKSKAAAAARKRAAAKEKAAAASSASRATAGKRGGAKGRGKAGAAAPASRPAKARARGGRKGKAVRGASPDVYDDVDGGASAGDKGHAGPSASRDAIVSRERDSPTTSSAPTSTGSAEESPEEGEVTTRRTSRPVPDSEVSPSVAPTKHDAGNMSDTRSQCRSMSSAGKSTSVKARARAVFGQSHSLKTMKELKYLSDMGATASMDKRERLTRTKACLVQLGDDIVAAGIVADTLAALELWRFIADKCHTGLAGERLQKLYAKLTVSFPRDGSRGKRAAALPPSLPAKSSAASACRSPNREPAQRRATRSASPSRSPASRRALVPSKRRRSGSGADKAACSAAPDSNSEIKEGAGHSSLADVDVSPPAKRAAVERQTDDVEMERQAQEDLAPRRGRKRSASTARLGSPSRSHSGSHSGSHSRSHSRSRSRSRSHSRSRARSRSGSLSGSRSRPASASESPRHRAASANGGGAERSAGDGSGSSSRSGAASVGGGSAAASVVVGGSASVAATAHSSERRSPRRDEPGAAGHGRIRSASPGSRRPRSRGDRGSGGGGSAGRDHDRDRRHRSRDGSRDGGRERSSRGDRDRVRRDLDHDRERDRNRDRERDRDRVRDRDRDHDRDSGRDSGRDRERDRGIGRERARERDRERDRAVRDARTGGPGAAAAAGSSSRWRDDRDGHGSVRDSRGRGDWERDRFRKYPADEERGRGERDRPRDGGRKREHRSPERERDDRPKRGDERDRERDRDRVRYRDGRDRERARSYGSFY